MRPVCSISVVVFLVIVMNAGWAVAQDETPITVTPIQLGGATGDQRFSRVAGSLVVFEDADELSRSYSYIRYRKVGVTGSPLLTIPPEENEFDSLPDVSGTHIVFTRWNRSTGRRSIMVFDTAGTAGPIEISPGSGEQRWRAAIGGDTVAFIQGDEPVEGSGRPARDLCVASVSRTLDQATCLTAGAFASSPAVSADGRTIVWTGCSSGRFCDIYVTQRDASGTWGVPRLLADSGGEDHDPDIDGQVVTWTSMIPPLTDDESTRADVYYTDVSASAVPHRVEFTDDGLEQLSRISGSLLAFLRVPPGAATPEIHLLDVTTHSRFVLTGTAQSDAGLVDVSHDGAAVWVTWTQRTHTEEHVERDVWAATFSLTPAQHAIQPLFDNARAYKRGSVVPIRLRVLDASGGNLSSPSLMLTATGLVQADSTPSAFAAEDAGSTNPDSVFRYDSLLQGYVFNLSTKGLAAGTWELRFTVGTDPQESRVTFDIR